MCGLVCSVCPDKLQHFELQAIDTIAKFSTALHGVRQNNYESFRHKIYQNCRNGHLDFFSNKNSKFRHDVTHRGAAEMR